MKFPFMFDMSESEYHADPCAVPSLSASTAKTLINRCPRIAWEEHPKLGGQSRVSTREMDRGTIVHAMLLGQSAAIQVLDFPDYRTKAAQQARDAAKDAGVMPVLEKEMRAYDDMATSIRSRINRLGIEFKGHTEGVVLWADKDQQGASVSCRSRMDHVDIRGGILCIDDIKTTTDASPKACVKQILNYGYDIQAAAYTRAIEHVAPEWCGRIRFTFLFVEDAKPHLVTPITLDGAFLKLGLSKWQRAVNLWSRCLHSEEWPEYTDKPLSVSPPQWAIMDEIEASPSPTDLLSLLES